MTKLSSALPEGDANGLTAIARALVDEPLRVHAVIALVDCKKTTTDNDTGATEPTARVRRVEVVASPSDLDVIGKVMRRAMEGRTGQTVLPMDLEDELESVFRLVDPETGEMRPPDATP